MKRSIFVLASLATIGILGYVATQIFAQGGGQPNIPATKVGVLNLRTVMKKYVKWQQADAEFQAVLKDHDKQLAKYQEEDKKAKDILSKPDLTPTQRTEWEKYATQLKRNYEDGVKDQATKATAKNEANINQLYREIEQATQRYSAANGYHMIFLYFDLTEQTEKYMPQFIQHKLTKLAETSCAYPFYYAPSLDVSNEIVNVLNSAAGPSAAPPAANAPKQ